MTGAALSQRNGLWLSLAGFILFASIGLAVSHGSSDALDRQIFLTSADWARSHPWLMMLLAGVGYVVDRNTGAGYDYPATLTVVMHPAQEKEEGPPPAPGVTLY